ncbi:B3 domain-containing protein At1g16640-like [Aegilops tauschii subsp. strangulata]|uniref:B3 domain-containing protein At1g16640-like n=1 Tax=Aegilops tauschii subsp. strangulata TaxID=200361 RepID=UPI003CC8A37F
MERRSCRPWERRGGVGAPRGKRRNYGQACPTLFSKVILAPKLESLPLPLGFTKHFPAVPTKFRLKTYTGCAWRVMVSVIHDRVTLDQGWASFVTVHQIRIGYMVTLKLLTPDTLMVVFNDDGMEVVTKCKKYDDAFAVTV